MKLTVDGDNNKLVVEKEKKVSTVDLYSKEGFEILSELWVNVGWNEKYSYTFTWLGRPVIQLPEDMIRIQEAIYNIKPDVIIETGVAHGGSLIFYASLFKLMGKRKVIGVDIEIRPHNRKAIENHELFPFISLIEGDSNGPDVLKKVSSLINSKDKVMVILDSNHTKEHVLKELNNYSKFVSVGSYIVATDGVMEQLIEVPRGNKVWKNDNPKKAAEEFLKLNKNFILEIPKWNFNESPLDQNITYWPSSWLKRIS